MFTKILNDEERKMFNKIHEIKSEIVFIKKAGNKYYVSINADDIFCCKFYNIMYFFAYLCLVLNSE